MEAELCQHRRRQSVEWEALRRARLNTRKGLDLELALIYSPTPLYFQLCKYSTRHTGVLQDALDDKGQPPIYLHVRPDLLPGR